MNLVMVGYKAKDLLDKTICKSVSSSTPYLKYKKKLCLRTYLTILTNSSIRWI